MNFLKLLAAGAVAFVASIWTTVALADMTGAYAGADEAAGTTLQLEQTGTALYGLFAGEVTGVLIGATDGGDNATGTVILNGTVKLPFEAAWTAAGLEITLIEPEGDRETVFFALGGTQPPKVPTQPAKPTPTPITAVLDDTAVNEALRALIVTIADAEYADATPEVRAILVSCLMDVTAALPTADRQYLIDIGFDPDPADLDRFERAVPGIDDATNACFRAADGPARASVTLANGATATVLGRDSPSFRTIEGGYLIIVGGVEVTIANGALTAAGIETPLPAAFSELVVTVANDGTVTATLDGAALPLGPALPVEQPTTPAKPGPVTPPVVTNPVEPPALDDAAVNTALRALVTELVAAELADGTPEARATMVECLIAATAALPTGDRQLLIDIGFDPDETEIAHLEMVLPGVAAAVGACYVEPEAPARTSVTLPGGQLIIVEGGANHVFEQIEGGYRIAVDGTDIIATATELTVGGAATPLPATFAALVVLVGADGTITATVDGAPLPLN